MYFLGDLGIVTLFNRIAFHKTVHSMQFTSQFVTGMLSVYTVVSLAYFLHCIYVNECLHCEMCGLGGVAWGISLCSMIVRLYYNGYYNHPV